MTQNQYLLYKSYIRYSVDYKIKFQRQALHEQYDNLLSFYDFIKEHCDEYPAAHFNNNFISSPEYL